MPNRAILTTCALLTLALTGCGLQPGKTAVKYERGKSPRTVSALDTGRFSLYSSTDATPDVTYWVEKGEQVGFRKSSSVVEAVAGDNPPVPLEDKMAPNHYWKYRGR